MVNLVNAFNDILPIEEDVLKAVAAFERRQTLPKHTVLINEGGVTDEVHFIDKGLVRAFYYHDQKEVTSWFAHEGQFIWPIQNYLLRLPSKESIQLLENTTLITLKRSDIDTLRQQYDVFNGLQCRIMERYLPNYDVRIKLLLMKGEHRLALYEKTFPHLARRVPLRHIASYLGMDRATVSRLRGSYRKI